MPGIGFFHDYHPVIAGEISGELALSHIHGKHPGGSALQQTIKVNPPVDEPRSNAVNPVTSSLKWSSACSSLWPPRLTNFFGSIKRKVIIRTHGITGFARRLAIDPHLSGQDKPFGAFPAVTKTAFDQ